MRRTVSLLFCLSVYAPAQSQMGIGRFLPRPTDSTVIVNNHDVYVPMNKGDRMRWVISSTLGVESLAGGVWSSGWGILTSSPDEYGRTWRGFGQRFGMRLTGISTSNVMEASLGHLWGEDPRYFRARTGTSYGGRVGWAIKGAFVSPDSQGHLRPAYARCAAYTGSNFLSNTWRPDSDSSGNDALLRVGTAFAGRMFSNGVVEFWPEIKKHVFRRK